MRFRRAALLGLVGSAFIATSAIAADVPPVVVAPPAPPPPVAIGFDWAGLYVGAHGGDFLGPSPLNFGLHGGFNVVNGRLLYGVDARVSLYGFGPPSLYEVIARARAGFLLGDRLLVFGAAGIGLADGPFGFELGGGAELALGQRLSIRAEMNWLFDGGGLAIPPFWTVGLTFHPGN